MSQDRQQLQDFIIRALADDYESVEIIMKEATQLPEGPFTGVTRELLLESISDLVDRGIVKPHRYSEASRKLEPCQFSRTVVDSLWFGLTESGRKALNQLG